MSLEVAVVFGLPASSSQHFCATLVFPSLPSPALSRTGSFSHELGVHFREQLTCHPPVPRGNRHFSWGFFPLRDISTRSPLTAELPDSATFRPQCFTHSRRFAPPCTFVGLFRPTATSGIPLQGFPLLLSRFVSSTIRPLMSLPPSSCCRVSRQRRIATARLQGLHPSCSPLLLTEGFSLCQHSIPSCVFNSLGSRSAHLGDVFTSPPLMAFTARAHCARDG